MRNINIRKEDGREEESKREGVENEISIRIFGELAEPSSSSNIRWLLN
jgi:hypothetical protein